MANFKRAWYWPGSVSDASSNTGAMPACDMSASKVMRAPEIGFAAGSANLRRTVAGPTCGGSGEILCSTVTAGDESIGLEHPVTKKAATQGSARRHRPTWAALRTLGPHTNQPESQAVVH